MLVHSYANPEQVTIKAATPVKLKLTEEVSSNTKHVNEEVCLAIEKDVVIGYKVVIKKGTPASGTVRLVLRRGRIGRAGQIQFSVESTAAADGTPVMLRGTFTQLGYDRKVQSIVLGAAVCPFFLLMRGTEDYFSKGTILKGYTENDVVVNVE